MPPAADGSSMAGADLDRAALYALHEPPARADPSEAERFLGAVTQRAVAGRLRVVADADEAAVSRALGRLLDRGLVVRTDPISGRGPPSWTLTDLGKAEAERLPRDLVAEFASREVAVEGDDGEWLTHFFMSYLR